MARRTEKTCVTCVGANRASRRNFGTACTGWQEVPDAEVHPCPANGERGWLQLVNRNRTDAGMRHDRGYQCYVAGPVRR